MRSSGILLHLSSLPSSHGIGTMGKAAYAFVDFLVAAGQSFWQVLPIGPTSYGDSPYQSFSTFAGNPYFIDLDLLCEDGLLTKADYANVSFGESSTAVDYAQLYRGREPILRKAYHRGITGDTSAFETFCAEHADWLEDYALFMALKAHFGEQAYADWDADIRGRTPSALAHWSKALVEDVGYHKFVQYLFFSQWGKLKAYANKQGIKIIGDLPIYVAADSADAWANRALFLLDEDCKPLKVAGVPPDAFSESGQLWGNPVYDWQANRAQGYAWWQRRIRACLAVYDVVRIDHFRAFASFYAVDAGAKDARKGEWLQGPGMELFSLLRRDTKGFRIIAEDLGIITDDVRALLRKTGFHGMKVMQFGLSPDGTSDHVPFAHGKGCVSYIGTHDNETFLGWLESAPRKEALYAKRYMRLSKREGYHWGAIRTLLSTSAPLAIVTMQDLLGLGNEARMNTPATVGGNWQWRMEENACNDALAAKLRRMTATYGRLK